MENEELEMEDWNENQDLLARLEKAEASAEKWKARFKAEKSAQNTQDKQPTEVSDDVVSKKVSEALFFQNNEFARNAEKEIRELQKWKNLSVEEAYTLHIARTNPTLLQKQETSSWVDWFTSTPEQWLSIDTINSMSDEELEKAMKSALR